MARKPGLTTQEHIDLGLQLAAVRDELQRMSVLVSNAYPHTSPQAAGLRKALAATDTARSALDGALAREDRDGFDSGVYYPGSARPAIEFRAAA